MLMHRTAARPWGSRTLLGDPSSQPYARIGKRLAGGKDEHDCAERCDKGPIHSIGHGTHQSVGYRAAPLATLNRVFGARKGIVNCWLRRNLNGEALSRSRRRSRDTQDMSASVDWAGRSRISRPAINSRECVSRFVKHCTAVRRAWTGRLFSCSEPSSEIGTVASTLGAAPDQHGDTATVFPEVSAPTAERAIAPRWVDS
jgi:hypothetical protein